MLILNQSYEPISVCSGKKAVLLLFLTKAEIVTKRDGLLLRSISASLPYPSVIRLLRFVHIPYKRIELTRKNIHYRDESRCQYCGAKTKDLTIDHVVPKSRGGVDTWENLVTACKKCNNKKGNRMPKEAGMKLINAPYRPNHLMFLKKFINKEREDWKQFLFM